MNEYIYVEFRCDHIDAYELHTRINALGTDFVLINTFSNDETNIFSKRLTIYVEGKIKAEYATILKLRDPFLAERMHVSTISEDLKNIYRKK